MQELLCSCSGKPKESNNTSSRCQCPAMIRLLRTDDQGWYICESRLVHNHKMLSTCAQKLHFSSHRHIDSYTRQLVAQLRENNVNLAKVYSIIGTFFGRIENVPFTKRSLCTLCGKISREQADDDVRKTMEMFSELKEKDSEFTYTVDVDSESRIQTLLWSNGRNRLQYHHFGDVVTFDTTYKTNLYDMPFGLFVGVNNHFQSVLYAGVLMCDERIESFEWVFREFVKMMGGKRPITILTDQARAMEVAIENVWPGVTHHWCKWHVLRKAKESLDTHYSKKSEFRSDFHNLINEMLTIDEFEKGWKSLLEKHGLAKNTFLIQNVFMKQYRKLQYDREQEEGFQEKRTTLSGAVIRFNLPIERHAAKIYTRTMFEMFGKVLYVAGYYMVQEIEPKKKYAALHVNPAAMKDWQKMRYEVTLADDGAYYTCECGRYEHMGMICSHILKVMITLDARKIPDRHVMKRWTVDVRDILPDHIKQYQKDMGPPEASTSRHSAMYITALEVVQLGDSNPETFECVMTGLCELKAKAAAIGSTKDGMSLLEKSKASSVSASVGSQQNKEISRAIEPGTALNRPVSCADGSFSRSMPSGGVQDEATSKNQEQGLALLLAHERRLKRGRPTTARDKPPYEKNMKRSRFCSICREPGHKSLTCPQRGDRPVKPRKDPQCSSCGLTGHRKTSCSKPLYSQPLGISIGGGLLEERKM